MKEEGRLDVFFANVSTPASMEERRRKLMILGKAGIATFKHLDDSTAETFMKLMRVNALSYVL